MAQEGVGVWVISEAFGVDDHTNEDRVAECLRQRGMLVTTGHDASRLYGLLARTRTAAVNGSLIPRMLETARMTRGCVAEAGIRSPLMIMRCDGGVMTTGEMETRPILTLLSGLAAGVAGALMYEKVSNGIFLEAGGTSTDISAIKNGKVMVKTAEVGGQKLYLSALDVRTRGVAGGSLIRVKRGKAGDLEQLKAVGPRSAHIAGLAYECFSPALEEPRLRLIAPCEGDAPDYAVVEGKDGSRVALTLAGAANVCGYVPEGDYAQGDMQAAQVAWQALGDYLGLTAKAAAAQALARGTEALAPVVQGLVKEYQLEEATLELVGGGGSAAVIVPYLAEQLHYRHRLAKNAPIISTLGVAMAMLREVVERNVVQPTQEDIRAIRRDALEALLQAGAAEATVEITVEVDRRKNLLRAIAMGTQTAKAATGAAQEEITPQAYLARAVDILQLPSEAVQPVAQIGQWHIFSGEYQRRGWLLQERSYRICALDSSGVARLVKACLGVVPATKATLAAALDTMLTELTTYGTVGGILPRMFVFIGHRQLDLTNVGELTHIEALLEMELQDYPQEEPLLLVAVGG